jgi:hypothetical protein
MFTALPVRKYFSSPPYRAQTMMTLEISMEREVVCMLTCSDLLEAEVEVFWLRGKRLNKPGVTGKREFGLLEGQGLEEGAEPGVEELVGVAGGEAAEGVHPHSLPGQLMRIGRL